MCIGSELLTGKVNTHAAYLGSQLASIGLFISREHTVGDGPELMRETFADAWRRADIVISAGGLGPTFDDLTRDVWSKVVKRSLAFQDWILRDIQQKFKQRSIKMPPHNRRQAYVLRGAEVLPNPFGTAPGQFLTVGRKILILLPGPPRELYPMTESHVIPRLKKALVLRHCIFKTVLLVGVPESEVDQKIRPLVARYQRFRGCRVTHGILASQSVISVRFIVEGPDAAAARQALDALASKFRRCLGSNVFGEDNDTLESVVGRLLLRQRKTLSVAESCTGGLIGKIITDQPGSSSYFLESVTAYSDQSKIRRLGVKKKTLSAFGAVSKEVAREMALGIKRTSGSDFSLSVTGIAGPDGGSPAKPVGLVYIGCSGRKRTFVREFRFSGDRGWIRHRSALIALDILRRELLAGP